MERENRPEITSIDPVLFERCDPADTLSEKKKNLQSSGQSCFFFPKNPTLRNFRHRSQSLHSSSVPSLSEPH